MRSLLTPVLVDVRCPSLANRRNDRGPVIGSSTQPEFVLLGLEGVANLSTVVNAAILLAILLDRLAVSQRVGDRFALRTVDLERSTAVLEK